MGRHTTAHPYAAPVLAAFDAVRNCSNCRKNTDEDCKAWRKIRKVVAVLRQEARRYAKMHLGFPHFVGTLVWLN